MEQKVRSHEPACLATFSYGEERDGEQRKNVMHNTLRFARVGNCILPLKEEDMDMDGRRSGVFDLHDMGMI